MFVWLYFNASVHAGRHLETFALRSCLSLIFSEMYWERADEAMNYGMGFYLLVPLLDVCYLGKDAFTGLALLCDLSFLQTWKFGGLSLLYCSTCNVSM